jgi:glyoxylase-like metal-dependent hydrolase (beta-lactamase superfamily II)
MPVDAITYSVGTATVTRVQELLLTTFTPHDVFADWRAEEAADPRDDLLQTLDADKAHLLMSVHTWVVRDRGRTILVDTGVGNDKPRPYTPGFDHLHTDFLGRLAAAGITPEYVDFVLLTHLHVDHVGWNTELKGGLWESTFPNARYMFARAEYDYFIDPTNLNDRNKTSFLVQQDSVQPVIEAGLADTVAIDGSEAPDGFRFYPTPGHSAHHTCIGFTSAGETALFAGDLFHNPIQVRRPAWNSMFDAFADEARQSRRWALDFSADHDALVFTSHFPASSAGKVNRDVDGYRWRFLK